MRSLVLAAATFLALGCSSRTEAHCDGVTCSCPEDSVCEIDPSYCDACSYTCGARSHCTGRCPGACGVTCARDTMCDVGVGSGGSVTCEAGSECHVTCALACSATCTDGALCTLRCATDAAAHTFMGTASCT